MAGELTAKLRLVKCPRCHGILPELAPVYQCAGCGTVLQAKKRKNDAKDTESRAQEPGARKNEFEHCDDKEARILTEKEISPLSQERNFGSDQNEIQDSNGEHTGDSMFSSDLSTELRSHVNEESSPAARVQTEVDQDGCFSEQNNGGDQHEYGYSIGKRSGGVSFSNEVVSSTELNHLESEESSPVAGAHSEEDLEQKNGRNQNEFGYCNGKQLGGLNYSDELASTTEINRHESEQSPPLTGAHQDLEQNNERNKNEDGYCNGKQLGGLNYSDELASTTEINRHESEQSSPLTGAHSEVDENSNSLEQNNGRNQSEFGDDKRDWPGDTKFPNEVSSSTERTCQEIQESPPLGGTSTEFDDNFKSRFIFGSLSGDNLMSASLRDTSTTAHRPLGGSNLTDNQMSPHSEQLGRSKKISLMGFDRVSSQDSLEIFSKPSSDLHVKDMPKFPTRCYYADDSSVSSYDGTDGRRDVVRNTISGHPFKSRRKFETDARRSKLPFYSRASKFSSENGSPSNYRKNDLQCSTSFHSANKPQYLEEEKLELLKMIYELQDQLNRTQMSKGKEKQNPCYYDPIAPEVEFCYDFNSTRYPGRSWAYQNRTSRIPFLGEATTSRYQVDPSGLHCFSQDWNCPAQLPPHICYSKRQYTGSSTYSPQHYTGSEVSLQSCDLKSDDHWHTNHDVVKRYSRERDHLVKKKRHVLPVAGAAPFLVCYGCSRFLQLPADFLVFGRRRHQLRCSACSVILKFSLRNGTHIVPYTASCALAPMSSFDDCGPSVRQSYSTEDELPLQSLNRESYDRKMPVEGREKQSVSGKPQTKYKKRSKAEKLSSEIEELPQKSGFPLHRLMGYSSPSEVMES